MQASLRRDVTSDANDGAASADGEAPPPADHGVSADDDDADSDDSDDDNDFTPVVAGDVYARDDVCVGLRVAVPFRIRGVETHLAGEVVRVKRATADVRFDDDGEVWEVSFGRLFRFTPPSHAAVV